MEPYLQSFLRLCLWLTILAVVFVPLERLFALHPQKIWRKAIGVDLCYYFLSSILPALALSAPIGMMIAFGHWALPAKFLGMTAALPFWGKALAGLVVGEIGYYWGHRLSHEIPFLWRFHAIHHSAEHLDFLVNTHAHPVDLVVGRFCSLAPIYMLGLGEAKGLSGNAVPSIVAIVGIAWGFFIHANVRWRFGPLEWLVATPMFHHWHHTLNGPINKNYASTLPWLDRLFGTHHMPANQWPEAYGVESKIPQSLAGQLMYPLSPPEVKTPTPAASRES